ncbi:uncharacterized protein LOC8063551 isoform X2 [Sorghum bicolor]|uniref:Uncharacterized protein n=1 Tax=Sorghum bicolor TaxID=4558 RepID=A0A1B6P9V7_SORBI|nr:uncharacterized protein LOC8063551 isoform X2 [Sorghum bicolor]KXG22497.1 hypothetical protein SORBI_3009G223500 [Sorghum bicolor]|eukprot:XP_021303464.1 uncharacterized protein LOC8063551 isoform X2 [Sorghum bicolor]
MSDLLGSRYDKQEDFQVLLSKKDPGEPPRHKHYLWMAHWTKASSSAEARNNNGSNPLEDINKGTTTKDGETLPYEFMKSTVAERLMVGVSRGSASMQHARQFNSSMWGMARHVSNELGPKNSEQVDESFEKSMKHDAVNLRARAVVSETYSIHKLSELPLDFQDLGSSDDPSPDWSHFPMFEINRKIDSILNRKRKSAALGPAPLNLNVSASHVMALSSQEYMMHSHQIADKNMDTCKPAEGFASHIEDPAGLNSDPSGPKLKGQLLDTMSCSCSKDDNNSADCPIDEQHTSHYFANSKHELPYVSNEKEFKFAGNSHNRMVSSAAHNLKTRRSAVCKQQSAAEAMFCEPVLGSEFQNEPITICTMGKKDGENFHEMYKSRGKAVSCSLLPYEHHRHLKAQRTESAGNLKVCALPDQTANKLTEKSNGELLAYGAKSKEMYTGKSSGFGVCMYGTNIGSRLFGEQNQSSAKTETLHSDTLIGSKSSAGIASLPAQKDYGCPDKAKSEQLAAPSKRGDSGYSKEDGTHTVNEGHDVSSKATIGSKQPCMPGTGITNLDLILSQMSRMRNQISRGIIQPPIGAEPSDRWLKRLQLDISDPDMPGSKRPKIGDSPPLRQRNRSFDMALPCNRTDTEAIDRVKEDQSLDEGKKLQEQQERTPILEKSVNSWIGRWCQGGTPVYHEDPGQGRQGTKPGRSSEELEGQFPSIAAMAMMGRAMNKLRPCEHQKKGPFVVWKTD